MPLLLSPFFDYSAEALKQRSDKDDLEMLTELLEYERNWSNSGFLNTMNDFLTKHDVSATLLKRKLGERSLSNLNHLIELLHEAETKEGMGLVSLAYYLSEKIHSDDKDDERYEQRLETDAAAVQIMTIHKSKGLEFPIVFVAVHVGQAVFDLF